MDSALPVMDQCGYQKFRAHGADTLFKTAHVKRIFTNIGTSCQEKPLARLSESECNAKFSPWRGVEIRLADIQPIGCNFLLCTIQEKETKL